MKKLSGQAVSVLFLLGILVPLLSSANFAEKLYYGVPPSDEVFKLQEILRKEGLYQYAVDGKFFGLTKKAVKDFQGRYGLQVDGIVGPQTRGKLNELYPNYILGGNYVSGTVYDLPFRAEITSGPANNSVIETDQVTFKFRGIDYAYPASDLTLETKLEGYEDNWQTSWWSGERTIYSLPGGNKTFTFKARAKRKNGEVSASMDVTFRAALSPYYKKVTIGSVSYYSSDFNQEYATLYNYSYNTPAIDVTNWKLSALKEEFIIPKAIKLFDVTYPQTGEDILLASGQSAKIYTTKSPIGNNFLLNKCFNYIESLYQFPIRSYTSCPWPNTNDLSNFSASCRTFFSSIPTCTIPNLDDPSIVYDNECRDYLRTNLNYGACVASYQKDSDFYKNEWDVYLGYTRKIWNQTHDTVTLRDKDGLIVDRYIY